MMGEALREGESCARSDEWWSVDTRGCGVTLTERTSVATCVFLNSVDLSGSQPKLNWPRASGRLHTNPRWIIYTQHIASTRPSNSTPRTGQTRPSTQLVDSAVSTLRWPSAGLAFRLLSLWRSQRPHWAHMDPLLPLLRHPTALLSPAADFLPSLVTCHHPHPSPAGPARWSPLQCGVHLSPAHLHPMSWSPPLAESPPHTTASPPSQSHTPPSSSSSSSSLLSSSPSPSPHTATETTPPFPSITSSLTSSPPSASEQPSPSPVSPAVVQPPPPHHPRADADRSPVLVCEAPYHQHLSQASRRLSPPRRASPSSSLLPHLTRSLTGSHFAQPFRGPLSS